MSALRELRSRVLQFGLGAQKDPTLSRLLMSLGASMTPAGVPVTHETAFTYSAVWDAVNQISSDVAKVPLVLYRRRPDGKVPYTDSRLYRTLHDEWNPEMSSFQARRVVTAHALTWGNGYAEIERDGSGYPLYLWPITPDRVQIARRRLPGAARSELLYVIDGGRVTLGAADVLHLAGPGFDGIAGYDVIYFARIALGIALAAEQFTASFFANGTTFGGVLSTEEALEPEQATEIRTRIEALHKAADKAHKFLVLGGGFKYSKLATDPASAQVDKTREGQAVAVAQYWNIPLHKIKSLDRATNNNIEQQDLEYYKGCLLNWYTAWEQEYNRKLVPRLEYRQAYCKHVVEGFLRADTKTRQEALQIQRVQGVINADEWRDLEDRNPIEGGAGKLYIIQSGFVPLDKIGAEADARIDRDIARAEKDRQPAPEPAAPRGPAAAEEAESDAERSLRERAERAEAMAAEARSAAEESRTALIAAQAGGATAAAELERLRVLEGERSGLALALTVSADGLRAELDAMRAARAAELEELRALRDRELEARMAAAAAETARAGLVVDVEERSAEAAAAAAELETTRAALEALRLESEAAAGRAAALEVLEAQRSAELEAARAQLAAAELSSSLTRAGLVADLEARGAELEGLRQSAAEVEAARAGLVAEMAAAGARVEALELELERERRSRAERAGAILSAHRALVVDTLRRLGERETERGRRVGADPERVSAWLETFYDSHAETLERALLPVLRVHLAWMGSPADARAATRAIVSDYVHGARIEIRSALDSEAPAAALSALWRRWDNGDRAEALADRMVERGIEYAAGR